MTDRERLEELLSVHLADRFPESVVKGIDYGRVDPVMIGADVYGWAIRVARGGALSAVERERLITARDDLAASLATFPENARPYYETVLKLAEAALG